MKRWPTVFALTALSAATAALAQQPPNQPQSPTEPPTSTTPQEQSQSRTDPPNNESRAADRQALVKDCMKQVQNANPSVPTKDIEAYCDKQVNSQSPPQD